MAGLFLLAFLSRRASRTAALAGIFANLLFTTYATLTLGRGAILNLHQCNYPWSEFTIGAFGNLLLLAVGLLCTALFPAPAGLSSSNTLWDWLADRKRPNLNASPIGDTP